MQWAVQCPKQYINNCQLYMEPTLALVTPTMVLNRGRKVHVPLFHFTPTWRKTFRKSTSSMFVSVYRCTGINTDARNWYHVYELTFSLQNPSKLKPTTVPNPVHIFTTSSWKSFLTLTHICRLKLGNACYHSVQNLLSSRLLSKNLKIRYIEL